MMDKYLKNKDYLENQSGMKAGGKLLNEHKNQLEALSSLLINLINLTLTEFEQEMEGK